MYETVPRTRLTYRSGVRQHADLGDLGPRKLLIVDWDLLSSKPLLSQWMNFKLCGFTYFAIIVVEFITLFLRLLES